MLKSSIIQTSKHKVQDTTVVITKRHPLVALFDNLIHFGMETHFWS